MVSRGVMVSSGDMMTNGSMLGSGNMFGSALGCYQECYSWPEKKGMGEWSTIWTGALFIWRNLLSLFFIGIPEESC